MRLIQLGPDDDALRRDVAELRWSVWTGEGRSPVFNAAYGGIFDDEDDRSWHSLCAFDGALVGCARMSRLHHGAGEVPTPLPTYGPFADRFRPPVVRLDRAVVAPAHRRRGIALAAVTDQIELARSLGARTCVCAAGPNWSAIFGPLGFEVLATRSAHMFSDLEVKVMMRSL